MASRHRLHEWLEIILPRAIILSGGNDIGEYSIRDQTELSLLQYADAQSLPVLGICRGMQMLAHYSGVGLKEISGHAGCRHELVVNHYALGVYQDSVNSYHNKALVECPPCYEISALSSDKTIEGITHKSKSWEGWMWHPERENKFLNSDLNRAQEILM